jgi:hypothetical protein
MLQQWSEPTIAGFVPEFALGVYCSHRNKTDRKPFVSLRTLDHRHRGLRYTTNAPN